MNENEGQTREYKLIWNENAYKTCCAFANTDGGRIYVGYDDNGNLIGIRNVKGESENLPNSIRSNSGSMYPYMQVQKKGKTTSKSSFHQSAIRYSMKVRFISDQDQRISS